MLESQLIQLGLYSEQLRNRITYLENVIKELERSADMQQKAVMELNDE